MLWPTCRNLCAAERLDGFDFQRTGLGPRAALGCECFWFAAWACGLRRFAAAGAKDFASLLAHASDQERRFRERSWRIVSRASEASRQFDLLENWLQSNPDLIAAVLITFGFLLRLHVASGTFLDPDEALHFWAANRASLGAAYQGSLHLSHPPLLVLVLYFFRWFGTSEVVLRLPAAVAGAAFCWPAFKWLTGLFGSAAGWIGLIFLTFLPPMIALSSEVRQYALLLALLAGSAYLLERAFEENSAKAMVGAFVCLYLAMLSHYSAFLFAATTGIYATVRMAARRFSTKLVVIWIAGQLFGLGIAAFLYVTHLSRLEQLQGVHASNWLPTAYLPNSYFHAGNPLIWALSRTGSIFQYMFGQLAIGDVACLFFVVGVVFLLRRNIARGTFEVDTRLLGAFLLLPFVLTCAAALAGKYPYGGTRHSAFLALFAVAGISALLAGTLQQKAARGTVVAILVVILCNSLAWRHRPDMSREHMDEAVAFINQHVPLADTIFVDNQTGILLGHYLCQQKPYELDRSVANFRSLECAGHRIIATDGEDFWFTADNFLRRWNEMLGKYGARPDETVWVVQAGWNVNLAQQLRGQFPQFRDLRTQPFGKNISIFKLQTNKIVPDPAVSRLLARFASGPGS